MGLDWGRMRMRAHLEPGPSAVAALLLAVSLAQAHHGDAGRYTETVKTVTGSVVEFQFINPHSMLVIAVEDENGDIVEWYGELGPPNSLQNRWGWDKDTFQVGDVLTMTGRSLKNGGPYMTLSELSRLLDAEGNEIYVGD